MPGHICRTGFVYTKRAIRCLIEQNVVRPVVYIDEGVGEDVAYVTDKESFPSAICRYENFLQGTIAGLTSVRCR